MVIFPQVGLKQDWVANLKEEPKVRIYSGETSWEGMAVLSRVVGLKDPILGAFVRKYGEREVKKRYWGQLDFVRVALQSQTREAYDELTYSDLEAAFDGVADTYDEHIFGNPMNVWLRNRSLALMTKQFSPGDVVIEVGCGTGTETIALAKRGVKILATDISSKMLQELSKKAEAFGVNGRIVPIHCRPYEIWSKVKGLGYDAVDGAYSTYGAVNTEPRLAEMLVGLHRAIKANGILVLGVWNRFCLFEMVGYTLRARPSMTVARLRNPVPVGRSRFCVKTNSFSPSSLNLLMDGLFGRESLRGVEILLPPSNLTRYLPPPPLMGILKRVEVALEPKFPWNRLGDHFLAVYRRLG